MNHRLLTPAIILVSFGAALTVTGWHTGRWRAARTAERTASPSAPSPPALPAVMPVLQAAPARNLPDRTPASEPPAEQESLDVAPVALQDRASDGFLDARDRAAEHGARSH